MIDLKITGDESADFFLQTSVLNRPILHNA
jgi:hypothetical protein